MLCGCCDTATFREKVTVDKITQVINSHAILECCEVKNNLRVTFKYRLFSLILGFGFESK
jgi:hypothetical protein